MPSTGEYLDFVLGQLAGLPEITHRAMMGEYILYCRGRVFGGIYDDRLLLKPTKTAMVLMQASSYGIQTDIPYPGAREMLVADVDDRALTCRVVQAIAGEIPAATRKKQGGSR